MKLFKYFFAILVFIIGFFVYAAEESISEGPEFREEKTDFDSYKEEKLAPVFAQMKNGGSSVIRKLRFSESYLLTTGPLKTLNKIPRTLFENLRRSNPELAQFIKPIFEIQIEDSQRGFCHRAFESMVYLNESY